MVVKRAAANAHNESELYLLLADQIEDKEQKRLFIRKAMSVSGRDSPRDLKSVRRPALLCALNRVPKLGWRQWHVEMRDAERAQSVYDSADQHG